MIRPRRLAAIILCACALALPVAGVGGSAAGGRADAPVTIAAPSSAIVGGSLRVVASATVPDGTPATLIATGSYGARTYRATVRSGQATFDIPAEETHKSGVVSLTAIVGGARGAATLTLTPDAAVEPVVPLVGPRSIVADTREWTMVVAIPVDRFDNPLAEGTPVQVRARHADAAIEERDAPIRHLVSWVRFDSHTRAGQGSIAVRVGGVTGQQAAILEVPGWPVPFAISADAPGDLPADGRSLVALRTEVLRDQFGNIVADGTLVTFLVDEPGGERRALPAITIGGVAVARLRATAAPATITVRATVYDIASAPISVAFGPGPATGTAPVATRVDRDGGELVIDAGPLTGDLGGYAPDGTVTTFRVTAPDGRQTWHSATVAGGHATLRLRLAGLGAGRYQIEVFAGSGGGRTEVTLP